MELYSWFSTLVMDGDFLNKEKSFFNLFLFFYFTSNFSGFFVTNVVFFYTSFDFIYITRNKIGKRENRITFYSFTSFVFRLTFFFVIYIFCYRENILAYMNLFCRVTVVFIGQDIFLILHLSKEKLFECLM